VGSSIPSGAVSLAVILGSGIVLYEITARNVTNVEPSTEAPAPLKIEYLGGSYNVPKHELVANFRITNEGKEQVQIGEFTTAGLRFLNPDVKVDYPDYLLAEKGLSVSDNTPIQPGEIKDITITIQDSRWDTERLSGLAYDVDINQYISN
jgi:methane/ammonia monooxygenase subunit B